MSEYTAVISPSGAYVALPTTTAATTRRRYGVVSVLGAQSSGKSTLLNHLFGTVFPVMDATHGRSQTTRGVFSSLYTTALRPLSWTEQEEEKEEEKETAVVVVLDMEGNDGVERIRSHEEDIEQKLALFGLVLSDVLLLNVWFHDIGRFSASGYALLQRVFSLHLQLFSTASVYAQTQTKSDDDTVEKRVILVCVRDVDVHSLSEKGSESLAMRIKSDIFELWSVLPKSQSVIQYLVSSSHSASQTSMGSVFDMLYEVRVVGLPHYEFQRDRFLSMMPSVRSIVLDSLFSASSLVSAKASHRDSDGNSDNDNDNDSSNMNESTRLEKEKKKKIPWTDLNEYAQSVWQRIEAARDEVCVPAVRYVHSRTRCESIARDLTHSFLRHLRPATASEATPAPGVVAAMTVDEMQKAVKGVMTEYAADTEWYITSVVDEVRKTMLEPALWKCIVEQCIHPVLMRLQADIEQGVVTRLMTTSSTTITGVAAIAAFYEKEVVGAMQLWTEQLENAANEWISAYRQAMHSVDHNATEKQAKKEEEEKDEKEDEKEMENEVRERVLGLKKAVKKRVVEHVVRVGVRDELEERFPLALIEDPQKDFWARIDAFACETRSAALAAISKIRGENSRGQEQADMCDDDEGVARKEEIEQIVMSRLEIRLQMFMTQRIVPILKQKFDALFWASSAPSPSPSSSKKQKSPKSTSNPGKRVFASLAEVQEAFEGANTELDAILTAIYHPDSASLSLLRELPCVGTSGTRDDRMVREALQVYAELERSAAQHVLQMQEMAAAMQSAHAQTASSIFAVPRWLWIVLLILGWNELTALLSSPFYMLLAVIFAVTTVVVYLARNVPGIDSVARFAAAQILGSPQPNPNAVKKLALGKND
eukprot:ANDGO_01864.mRNA.1 Protein SEY1